MTLMKSMPNMRLSSQLQQTLELHALTEQNKTKTLQKANDAGSHVRVMMPTASSSCKFISAACATCLNCSNGSAGYRKAVSYTGSHHRHCLQTNAALAPDVSFCPAREQVGGELSDPALQDLQGECECGGGGSACW
jgi:hypothetical protein